MTLNSTKLGLSTKGDLKYIGRFAPSPTGPLHFGSLVAAVASYLDAKSNDGRWLVRIEDLDPPREPSGAADLILNQLSELGFQWDGELLYQSSRLSAYQSALQTLTTECLCFACNCTRGRIQATGSVYDGHCRGNSPALADSSNRKYAVRIKTTDSTICFDDLIQGPVIANIQRDYGDFVIRRKDQLFAYQLAVVVDDAFQNITHVVRGYDLLDSTARQIYLQQKLNLPQPIYAHFPVAADIEGEKLSKQHFAASIDTSAATESLYLAMQFLGLNMTTASKRFKPAGILAWGVEQWDIQSVPKLATINGSWTL